MSKEVVTMAGTDAMRERIARHPWPRGGVEVVRANRGYTLYSRRTGGQVARLRPTDRVARINGVDILTPTPVGVHAMRTDSGRPSSSMRFRARTAIATSVA